MIQHINNSLGSFISHAGEFYLSQSAQSSLSKFAHSFEYTEGLRHTENTEASPPAPLRMERGVVCEVTPFGLLLIANGPLNIRRTYRGISVITEGVSKCPHPLFLCTKPRLSQARDLLFPKVFVPLGIQKISL